MNNRTVIEPGIIVVGNQLQHSNGGSFASFKFGNIDSLKKAVNYCRMHKRIIDAVIDAYPQYIWD